MSDPSTLPAGPDLDKLVAKAIGLGPFDPSSVDFRAAETAERIVYFSTINKPDEWPEIHVWSPSTNWQHAMEAAERFGLFHQNAHYCCLMQRGSDDRWIVTLVAYIADHRPDGDVVASAETGPLAISRAILRLTSSPART